MDYFEKKFPFSAEISFENGEVVTITREKIAKAVKVNCTQLTHINEYNFCNFIIDLLFKNLDSLIGRKNKERIKPENIKGIKILQNYPEKVVAELGKVNGIPISKR